MAPTVDMIALLRLLARLVLVAVFVSAALPKLQDPAAFAVDIQNYRLSGPVVAAWGATVLPWLELTIGVGLLTRSLRRVSGLVIAALLILFIGLHASAWLRGLDVACGCFGSGAASSSPADYGISILRNLALLGLTAFLLQRDLKRP